MKKLKNSFARILLQLWSFFKPQIGITKIISVSSLFMLMPITAAGDKWSGAALVTRIRIICKNITRYLRIKQKIHVFSKIFSNQTKLLEHYTKLFRIIWEYFIYKKLFNIQFLILMLSYRWYILLLVFIIICIELEQYEIKIKNKFNASHKKYKYINDK